MFSFMVAKFFLQMYNILILFEEVGYVSIYGCKVLSTNVQYTWYKDYIVRNGQYVFSAHVVN